MDIQMEAKLTDTSNGLDNASLWLNKVNVACTIQKPNSIEEFVGQTVDAVRETGVTPALCWANFGAKVDDCSSCTSLQEVSVLNEEADNNDYDGDSDDDNDDEDDQRPDDQRGIQDDCLVFGKTNEDSGPNQDRFAFGDCICKLQDDGASLDKSNSESHSISTGSINSEIDCGTSNPKIRDFFIPCLNSINELETRFGSEFELHLKVRKSTVGVQKTLLNKYKFKKKLLVELEEWENELNERSPNEPYIAVENKVDNERPPKDFVYVHRSVMPPSVNYMFDKDYLVGCSCVRCTPLHCECPRNNGADFAYDRFGRIQFEPGKPVYECNAQCSCSVTCRNRVVQHGRTVKVAIFRTSNGCGWGVKPMESIQKNQFVTEYVGELITNEEAEERGKHYDAEGQTYLFDLDYNDGDCQYTLDAKKYGNISHFINHSCNPNLNVYGVWCDTLDPTLPRIALFASRDIAAGEEMTFDYLMTAEDKSCSSRKTKRIKCGCGSKDCRRYLF